MFKLVSLIVSHTKVSFLLFLSLPTVFINRFHSYTKNLTLIPLIPTPNSLHSHPDSPHCHPYSPHSHPYSPHFHSDSPHSHHSHTLIPRIPTLITVFPSLPPRFPAFPSFPPFRSPIPHSGFYR